MGPFFLARTFSNRSKNLEREIRRRQDLTAEAVPSRMGFCDLVFVVFRSRLIRSGRVLGAFAAKIPFATHLL